MKKLIVILILFSFTGLSGQEISFTEISEKDGLSSNYANTVYKDHMGFVWIGTQEGLNKYDGTDIKQYHSYPDKKFSISNDMIKTIAEDADSNLWIGTQYGLNLYDRSRDQFYRFFADSTDNSSLRDNEIKGFLLDNKQRFWIATIKGISGLEKKADGSFSFRNYLPIRKIKAHEGEWSIRFLHQDENGTIWTGSRGSGLMKFFPETGKFKHFYIQPVFPVDMKNNVVNNICVDKNGMFWLGTKKEGIVLFDPLQEKFTDFREFKQLKDIIPEKLEVFSLMCDTEGNIWIGTFNELIIIDKNYKLVLNKKGRIPGMDYKKKLPKSNIKDIYEDNTGIVWLAYRGGGVDKYDPIKDKFLL